MSDLSGKNVLIIGAGNMGRPVVDSVLKAQGVNPAHVTVIAGSDSGKDSVASIRAHIEQNMGKDAANAVHIISHEAISSDPAIADGMNPDYVFYGAKPQKFDEIVPIYKRCLTEPNHAQIISIAAGLSSDKFRTAWGDHHAIIRTMPHLPRTLYGVYTADGKLPDDTATLMGGMGAPVMLENEGKAFATYTAHAGCAPAFVAQFINRIAHDEASIAKAVKHLRKLVAGASPSERYHADSIEGQVELFYQNWLGKAKKDFDHSAASVVNNVIKGTLDDIERSNDANLADYANRVRSPKGVTNAGLLAMGLPVPAEERFGNLEQIASQNAVAAASMATAPSDSIVHALIAAEERSAAMAQGPNDDPLHGMDFSAVNTAAEMQIKSSRAR